MGRKITKARTEYIPSGRASPEEKEIIMNAWKDSGLGYTEFILLLVSFYRRTQMTPSQKRHAGKKEKK
jgi:hypothetical protein